MIKEEEVLHNLLISTAKSLETTIDMILSREKDETVCFARGIFCYIARELGIHPVKIAKELRRSRSSCITTAKRYKGYIESGDKLIISLVKRVKEDMDGRI